MPRFLRCALMTAPLALAPVLGCEKSMNNGSDAPKDAPHEHPGGEGHHPHQGGHHHGFADAEKWAPIFDDPARDEWQKPDLVLERVAPGEEETLGIVGAGTGYFAVRFAKQFASMKVYANDVEPDMVRHLGERAVELGLGNLDPVQGAVDDPAFPLPLELVFMCNVYHHVESPETFFQELAEDTEPGARVFIVEFKPGVSGDDVPGPPEAMRVTPDQISRTLAPLGFERVAVDEELLPYQYILELRAPGEPAN